MVQQPPADMANANGNYDHAGVEFTLWALLRLHLDNNSLTPRQKVKERADQLSFLFEIITNST